MKKAFYMMAAAAIALSSCSSEETTDVAKSSSITFRTSVGLNSRGAELTTGNLSSMFVSAYYLDGTEYFPSLEFTRQGSTNTFIPSTEKYWQNGKEYKFVAISPAANEWGTVQPVTSISADASTDKVTCTDFVSDLDIANQKDLVIGAVNAREENASTSGIELKLRHILSQVVFKVKNDNKYITYSIKEVRIVNAKNKATYTLMTATPDNGGKWTEPSEKATYTYKFSPITLNEANTTATLTAADGGAMLIPQTITPWNGKKVTETDGVSDYDGGAYISLLLNVKHTDGNFIYPANAAGGNSYGWVAVPLPTGTKWDKSNKYIYTLNLSTGCGKVDSIDPGTSVDPSSPTNPTGKDPGKGENVFGNVIKFDVTVLPWTDKNGVANGEATYDPNENIHM